MLIFAMTAEPGGCSGPGGNRVWRDNLHRRSTGDAIGKSSSLLERPNAKDIECADDQEAIQKAQQAVDGHNMELWERGRFITRLAAKPCTKK